MEPNGKRVLVVEDDPMLHRVLDEALSKAGYELFGAHDGVEGLKMIKAQKPDLVVLDVILPRMTGIELLAEAKKDPGLANMKVLLLTNETEMDTIAEAMAHGTYGYLIKSESNMETIVAKVKELIG